MSHLSTMLSRLSDLKLSAEFWDVRVEDTHTTTISALDGELVACNASPSVGAFVRVRKNGFFLYESTTDLLKLKDILLRLDSEETRVIDQKEFGAEKHGPFVSTVEKELRFSSVPLSKKIDVVLSFAKTAAKSPLVKTSQVRYQDTFKTKSYLNSAGTQFEFDFNQGGLMCFYTLGEGERIFGDYINLYGAKFSDLEGQDDKLEKHIESSAEFLAAPAIVPGKYKVLLSPKVAGVFTHESFGHKSEADFMLGNEDAMKEWTLGKKIAVDSLNIVDGGNFPGHSGYCPIDDDGTPAQKNYLIKDGILTGRLHSLGTAHQLGEKPTGNSRALNFEFETMVRMTTTYIEPGTESLEDIMKRSEDAILIDSYQHGSGLSTFTIAPTRAYRLLKDGKREPVRVTVISGSVFETLMNIEAISKDFQMEDSAIGGCGKMNQAPLPISDGGPYVLVKEMQVS